LSECKKFTLPKYSYYNNDLHYSYLEQISEESPVVKTILTFFICSSALICPLIQVYTTAKEQSRSTN